VCVRVKAAMGRALRAVRFAALAAALTASAAVAQGAAAGDPSGKGQRRGPNVVQLSYEQTDHGVSVQAYAYRTDVLRFRTSYEGEMETADSRYNRHITDTDIDARGEARHPWVLLRNRAGKHVRQLIRESLHERGTAVVRILAHREGRVDDVRARINLSECSLDPPLYPVSCEVEV
jgi:hypothetical protein